MKGRLLVVGVLFWASIGLPGGLSAEILGLGDEIRADCSNVTRGDVRDSTITIVCGMPLADVVELVRLAASPRAGDRQALIARLDALVPAKSRFRIEAIARFFEILGEAPVESEKLADRFAEIATRHKRLLERVQLLNAADPQVAELRDAASAAIEAAEYDQADALLADAEAAELKAMRRLQAALEERALSAAAIRTQRGELARTKLDYRMAASHFSAATELVPAGHDDMRTDYLLRQASALNGQGTEFGDNAALQQAIAVLHKALKLRPREEAPLDWAEIQIELGQALRELGERETGTTRLEEAITAFREAFKEYKRPRVPLKWAETQTRLGIALTVLGARQAEKRQIEIAISAFRLALEEQPRGRVPLDWALTQSSLGIALVLLGGRETGTARLEEAIAAFRAALEEYRRERVPLDWART